MRATNATAVARVDDAITVTLYDAASGSSICTVLDLPVAERLALAIADVAERTRHRLAAAALASHEAPP
jgi:hypothetical protein